MTNRSLCDSIDNLSNTRHHSNSCSKNNSFYSTNESNRFCSICAVALGKWILGWNCFLAEFARLHRSRNIVALVCTIGGEEGDSIRFVLFLRTILMMMMMVTVMLLVMISSFSVDFFCMHQSVKQSKARVLVRQCHQGRVLKSYQHADTTAQLACPATIAWASLC